MSKYIIELKDDVQVVQKVGVTENGNAFVMNFYKDQLEELNSDYINEHFGDLQDTAYQKGINDGSLDVKQRVEGAYQRGFEDGKWKSEDGCTGCKYEGKTGEHLPCDYCMNNFKNQWTAKKQDDKIEVGDEVIYNGTTKCIVVRPEDDERYASLIDSDGTHYSADHRECKKTGRHFDIASILEDMRHD